MDQDTIVAISTPPGRGGIGIVRLSGPHARAIAAPMLRLRHPLEPGRARFGELLDLTASQRMPSSRAERAAQADRAVEGPPHLPLPHDDEWDDRPRIPRDESRENAQVLDQIVVTYFAAPHSYTGEDVIEIAMHGAPVLLEHVVRQCCAPTPQNTPAARLAEPGEFTQRAFLNGRIDLTQAEAVGDLIHSSTIEQARLAARQIGGSLARAIAPAKAALVSLIATLEAGIDFAEDDIDVLPSHHIAAHIAAIHAPLAQLERSFSAGRILREGLTLAIVGRPNAGKSSLFNCLVQRERAIVTATPGTTRDLVTETVAISGIPVHLIDTAGLRNREDLDEAERIGIAKSRQAIADADLILLVLDASDSATTLSLTAHDRAVLDHARENGSALLIARNKIDLAPTKSLGGPFIERSEMSGEQPSPPHLDSEKWDQTANNLSSRAQRDASADRGVEGPASQRTTYTEQRTTPSPLAPRSDPEPRPSPLDSPIPTSALTGEGIPALRAAILRAVAGDSLGLRESAALTNLRQHQAIQQSLRALAAATSALTAATPHEILLLDLYESLRGLDALTGATTNEDVLRLIFSTFCIGK